MIDGNFPDIYITNDICFLPEMPEAISSSHNPSPHIICFVYLNIFNSSVYQEVMSTSHGQALG